MKFHWSRLLGSSWKLHADKISFKVNMKGQRQASTDKDGFHTGSTRIRTLDQDNHLFWGWRADAFWRWTANPTESDDGPEKYSNVDRAGVLRWTVGKMDERISVEAWSEIWTKDHPQRPDRRYKVWFSMSNYFTAAVHDGLSICSLRVLALLVELLFVKYFTNALYLGQSNGIFCVHLLANMNHNSIF